jgi:flagellar biosynthetic protein FliP
MMALPSLSLFARLKTDASEDTSDTPTSVLQMREQQLQAARLQDSRSFYAIIILLVLTLLLPLFAHAEEPLLSLGEMTGDLTSKFLQILALISVLSLAPSIVMMVTSFTRIVVVLSFLRSALGLQQTPPNAVLISLAIFLSAFIMAPTIQEAFTNGIQPLIEEKIDETQAFREVIKPFQKFMTEHAREKDIGLFLNITNKEHIESAEELPLEVVIPAFMISELRRAFEIGFLIFIPFIIIDLLIASVLMAMGMMMLPPATVALPFKLIFFVIIDGWYMICGSLVRSYTG